MITEKELAKFCELNEQRKQAQRLVDALEKQAEPIKAKILAEMNAAEQTQCKRGEYLAQLTERAGAVKWKDEFISIAGADEALRRQQESPKLKSLCVQKIA